MTGIEQGGANVFDLQVVKHFNHLTLRNGVSLAGLGREPRDLEVFFRTAVFFISEAGAFTSLQKEAFIERLTEFLSAHARWLKARPMDVYEAMCGCGFVGEQNGECVWKLEVCEPVGNVSKVLAAWAHFDEARVRRRSKMRALLQARNRAVNALPAPKIDPELDAELMHHALRMAQKAYEAGEVPVGAVLAVEGNIVAEAGNEVIARHDPTAHAEMLVLRKAAALQGSERFNGAVLYVTLEPCAMCSAAMSLARVSRVVWGADDPMSGGMRGALNVIERARMNHRVMMTPGVLRADCERILKKFFEEKRSSLRKGPVQGD